MKSVCPGFDWRGVGRFQVLEEAFKMAPEGVPKAHFELKLQDLRAMFS